MADLDRCVPMYTASTPAPYAVTDSANAGVYYEGFRAFNRTSLDWTIGINNWVQYDFGSSLWAADGYYVRCGWYQTGRAIKSWTLKASNTGAFGGEEVTLDTQTNVAAWYIGEKRTYTFANTTTYQYYRLTVTDKFTFDGFFDLPEMGILAPSAADKTFVSVYPTNDSDHVKATTEDASNNYHPYYATDKTKSLTGAASGNSWRSVSGSASSQRFHMDLGKAVKINRIYFENYHNSGADSIMGAAGNAGATGGFLVLGSNTASAFNELTYATDTDWTSLTVAGWGISPHMNYDAADGQYVSIDNTVAYRYYAIKFLYNQNDANYMGLRRVELQTSFPLGGPKIINFL